jgi:hypothetical protein
MTKRAENDFGDGGYGRVTWDEHNGDSSRLEIKINDGEADAATALIIRGSIKIAGFFNLIDEIRRAG